MKARHVTAALGVAFAVGSIVFMQSFVATNDAQGPARAAELLKAVPVAPGARGVQLEVDFRPDGHVLQGPPMMAFAATRPGTEGVVVTRSFFAQRRAKVPPLGTELVFLGRKGAYRLKLTGVLDWDTSVRGYPNAFVSPETAATIDEAWRPLPPFDVASLAPQFASDAGRHLDRARPLLLWAAALTALCLLLNALFLSIESNRRTIAVCRMLGQTRGGVAAGVLREALALSFVGALLGVALALGTLFVYVRASELFPCGMAVSVRSLVLTLAVSVAVSLVASLCALKSALAVRPLEAASVRAARPRRLGMLISFACGFGAFVAVEVWGASLTKPFIPSPEWPDAIVSILPGGVSSFDIEKLRALPGVRRIAELQPLQVNLDPLEPLKMPARPSPDGRPMRPQYRNALLMASDWLPAFRFVAGDRDTARAALTNREACIVTEMMARAHRLKLGDALKLDAGGGYRPALEIVGIVDLNWHMVTSRGLVRGRNRMPVHTDGPVFVSFDTLAACDPRPQEMVHMTHLWLDYEPSFLAANGVFPAGRKVEESIYRALGGAARADEDGSLRGNTVRLHARDEIADGTLAHGAQLVGAMARVPFIFIGALSLGFVALLVGAFEARRREFRVLRTIGATRLQLAGRLVGEALRVAGGGLALGLPGGALVGWLFTAGTRATMSAWGLPPSFALPVGTVFLGALGAVLFALLFAVPTALFLVRRTFHGQGRPFH